MTERQRLTRLRRVRVFERVNGICCICKTPIHASRGEKWVVEHIVPLWLGGKDDESNWGPAHFHCGIDKTRAEAPMKAKGDRVRANNLGIRKKPKGRPIPGTRASGIRIRMNRTVERWPT